MKDGGEKRKIRSKNNNIINKSSSAGKKKTPTTISITATPSSNNNSNNNISLSIPSISPPESHHHSGGSNITVVWTIVSNSDAIQKLLRTLHYIQEAAIQITNGVSLVGGSPTETRKKVVDMVLTTLDGVLTPISPTLRNSVNGAYRTVVSYSNSVSLPREISFPSQSASNYLQRPFKLLSSSSSIFGDWLESSLSHPGKEGNSFTIRGDTALQSLIMFVASQSGVSLDSKAKQDLPASIMLRLLKVIADTAGVDLEECFKKSQEQQTKFKLLLKDSNNKKKEKKRRKKDPKTGTVTSYKERDDLDIPWNTTRRIKKMMHHEISVKPFDAQIVLPSPSPLKRSDSSDLDTPENRDTWDECCSPNSFPPSPHARSALLMDFTCFTEEVLYRARDELRSAHTGTQTTRMAIFNPNDCHSDILLSCGGHCASKIGEGLYRSVRSALNITKGVSVLFEMSVMPLLPGDIEVLGSSICIGLSTKSLLLNAHVGSGLNSICLCSSGHVVLDGQWLPVMTRGFEVGDTIGVVVLIEPDQHSTPSSSKPSVDGGASWAAEGEVFIEKELYSSSSSSSLLDESSTDYSPKRTTSSVDVFFYVNGKPIVEESGSIYPKSFSLTLSPDEVIYPTLSLYTSSVKVMCHFTAADLVHAENALLTFPTLTALDNRSVNTSPKS